MSEPQTYGFVPEEALYTEDCPHCGHTIVEPEDIPSRNQRLCPECLNYFYQQNAN
jgi:formylmethanofuran dehydrogenase subunit E